MSLSDVYAALAAELQGQPPNQLIDLYQAATQQTALHALLDVLGRFRIGGSYILAMVLATADQEGHPSSRTVLCKGLDDRSETATTRCQS